MREHRATASQRPTRRSRSESANLLRQRPLSPSASEPLPAVFVKSLASHPLVYRKRIARADPNARPGDLVAIYGEDQQLLGYGLYNPRSEIACRVLRFGTEFPDEPFWDERLAQAVHLRRDLLRLDQVTDAYRLIHAESDGLPGLVVDRFGDTLSAEAFSLGMFQRCEAILARLARLCGTRHTLFRGSPQSESQEGFRAEPVASPELPPQVTINEYGTRFRVHFDQAHKTGFFCDQRENRHRLAQFCAGRSVLDLCCYTGGFAIQAAKLGHAAEVTGVDLDENPIAVARENARLNQVRVHFVQADVFAYMRDMLRNNRRYGVVVLDPPKLIRNRAELDEGTRKHFDLNRLALQLVEPGGVLLSCSCAGLLPESDFVRLIYSAARQTGRTLQVLARTGAAADHPVASNCPETEYLKCLWARVL